jgi:hypothetical protein
LKEWNFLILIFYFLEFFYEEDEGVWTWQTWRKRRKKWSKKKWGVGDSLLDISDRLIRSNDLDFDDK